LAGAFAGVFVGVLAAAAFFSPPPTPLGSFCMFSRSFASVFLAFADFPDLVDGLADGGDASLPFFSSPRALAHSPIPSRMHCIALSLAPFSPML
jgi:hypothetical protein